MMEPSSPNPRRRCFAQSSHPRLPNPSDSTDLPRITTHQNLCLRKGSTFHSPTSPRSPDNDPILNVPSLPRRSPTCSKQLEDSIACGDAHRIAQLIGAVDRSLSGLESFSSGSQDTIVPEALPVPRFMIDTSVRDDASMDLDSSYSLKPLHKKHHSSDSGIGSSETSGQSAMGDDACFKKGSAKLGLQVEVKAPLSEGNVKTGINGNNTTSALGSSAQHALSEYACRQIQKHIIVPIIREDKLKNFHPLVAGLPYRVARKEITCLRDLEKVLLWLAPKWSVSKASFLLFCETSIQCIHTTVEYLNESDQRRPTDRPYTQGYFLDLVEQVRQYASILSSDRVRTMSGSTKADQTSSGERLSLVGGLSQTGVQAELVRTKDGKSISLRTGEEVFLDDFKPGSKRGMEGISDEDALRSMARRKKSAGHVKEEHHCRECDKVFKRPCDLTKHEKTHSRPWKCSESNCKYYEYGWPTEKERDRHMNDKHSASPPMYKCRFHPCPYESKRESNCKQHMEKAHGWHYVRSKNNGKNAKRSPNAKAPPTPQASTPGSNIFTAPTPDPSEASGFPDGEGLGRVGSHASGIDSVFDPHVPEASSNFGEMFGPMDNTFPWEDTSTDYSGFQHGETSSSSHRASWDSGLAGQSTLASNFDDQSLFGTNFDWSNMNHDLTSLNMQLATPATSVEHHAHRAFNHNDSISVERSPQSISHPSLSPGGHGDAMLFTPFSAPSNDMPIDEGFDEFTQDLVARPTRDFSLFDASSMSGISGQGEVAMFEDLSSLTASAGWMEKGTDLNQHFGIEGDRMIE